MNFISIFNYFWKSKIISLGITYFIILYIVFLLVLFFTSKIVLRCNRRLRMLLIFISVILALLWPSYIYYRIGPLPYGPDSAGYSSTVAYIQTHGRWDEYLASHFDPYYHVFHVTIFEYSILSIISGTLFIYPVIPTTLIAIFILGGYILASRFLAKAYKQSIFFIELPLMMTLLYIATPPLGGLDAIPQLYSMALAIVAMLTLINLRDPVPAHQHGIFLFILVAIMTIISHLTSIILVYAFLVALYSKITYRSSRKILLISAIIILASTLIYLIHITFSITGLVNVLESFYKIIESGLKPVGTPVIAWAYKELGNSSTWILSWTLLPALATSILTYIFSLYLLRILRLEKNNIIPPLIFSLIMIFALAIGVFSRLMGIYILRYLIVPAYYGMYIAIPPFTFLLIKKKYAKQWDSPKNDTIVMSLYGIILIFLILFVVVISGIHDPSRAPWNGEPRLAPVTINDRIEMRGLYKFFKREMPYVRVHDVYIDFTKSKLRGLVGDYHSEEEVMKCLISSVCSDRTLRILQNINSPLLIITYRSTIIKNINYDIIASLNEHVILYMEKYSSK